MIYPSIPALFFEQVARLGERAFLRHKQDGRWHDHSWRAIGTRARNAAKGLVALGVAPGDRTGILSENRPEWVIADLASLCAGAADAPIYPTNTAAQCAYVINDSGAAVIFVSTAAQLDKLLAARERTPGARHFVCFDEPARRAEGVISLAELEAKGAASHDSEVDGRMSALGRDTLLTLLYTSGTTGEPKGVMLTHGNLLSNCEATARVASIDERDSMVSFLPLCHSFERMVGYYMSVFRGGTISYAESIDKLVDNIGEVRPTVLVSVPRVYEKVYGRFMEQAASASGAKKALMRWALKVGDTVARQREQKKQPTGVLALEYEVAHRLVFSKVSQRLGGRLRFCVSGGGPLSPDIQRFMLGAGIKVLEGYGLTETSPIISANHPDEFRLGSTGKPLDNVQVRIADDGEILARGPSIMKGYWNKPAETKAVLSPDGWLATGDVGHLDADGFLWITDRKKDLIKTAGGKYVAPQEIENLLKLQRFVEQVHVIGDKRPYCVAVIVPKLDALRAWAREQGLSFASDAELVSAPKVVAAVQADVDAVNGQLARYQTVKRFLLVHEPFTQENDQLTPTMKVKRKTVNARYAREIDGLYEGARE
jgi:long-chain acyl-CoA synthetase